MKEYTIYPLKNKEYDYYVLCLTFESDYINSLKDDLSQLKKDGKLLIDQVMITGNSDNRFAAFNYKDGKIDLSSGKNTNPDKYYRQLTSKLLKENYGCVQYSILTDDERYCIQNGIGF